MLCPRFVVHEHHEQPLRYLFSLEMADILVSWIVPGGPSLNPAHIRPACRVENHTLAYLHFEGIISRYQPGAGALVIWGWCTRLGLPMR